MRRRLLPRSRFDGLTSLPAGRQRSSERQRAMTRQRPESPRPEVELPITPMLDMTFQLLTFFIITYHPTSMEAAIDFALPAIAGKVPQDTAPNDPSPDELEVRA